MNNTELSQEFDGCLATSVRLIDRVIAATYDDALRPLGVRSTQVTLLVVIAGHKHLTAGDLVETLRIDQTTVSRNLSRLELQGYIERHSDLEDARSATIDLTPEGRKVLRLALPIWREGQKEIQSMIGNTAAAQLVTTAAKLSAQ